METVFIEVTKKRYDEFVKNYSNKLDWNICAICEPLLGSYNDFTNGKVWPESMVAKVKLYDGSEYHFNRQPEYFIIIEN